LDEVEDDLDDRLDFDGPAVQYGRLVAPLADSLNRRRREQRVAFFELELLDRAVAGDDGLQ
jgi:hypothetical protein